MSETNDIVPSATLPMEVGGPGSPPVPSTVPAALATVLERRYLAALDTSPLRLEPDDDDASAPVLRRVEVIGPRDRAESAEGAMTSLLAACHNPSLDLVTVLHGNGERHELYYGLRRRAGGASFANAMAGLDGAFRAQMPGLALGAETPMRGEGHAPFADFLAGAGALASVTGIPSGRRGARAIHSVLDQIVAAMGSRPYALMVVAEPLPIAQVEEAMAVCRSLISELHSSISTTVSRTEGGSLTETEQAARSSGGLLARTGPAIVSAVAFAMGAGALAPALSVASMLAAGHGDGAKNTSSSNARSQSHSEARTLSLLDADARYCSALVERLHDRLAGARGSGWWRTAVYLAAEDEAALSCAAQALRGAAIGDATQLEPIRLQRPAPYLIRDAMLHGRLLRIETPKQGPQHPLGAAHDALATCINAEELAVLVAPLRSEAPGIALRDPGAFALTAPEVTGDGISLGALLNARGETVGEVRAPARTLNEHVLVVGTPGSGKTNTCMRLLIETHEQLGVPFLVIEPAKTEYRNLAREPSLAGKLKVYSVGGEGAQLRLNPLRPVPGVGLLGHIDLLKAVFNASFAMFAGMPQILEQALIEVYVQRGWNLYTSHNDAFDDGELTADELEALLPSLGDLQDQVEQVLKGRSYSEEVRRNIGAALTSRLGGLRMGNKGLILDTRRSTPLEDLFDKPVVLELNNLRDDEEKSFVMALVLTLLSEYVEARQAQYPESRRGALQHITLIEEAHRLLSASRSAGAETADPLGKGVAVFTQMLAELRALGEGFIVAEQIPTKLASDVLKNTNLKIIHRLTAPSDCAVLGDAANLDAAQLRQLVSLPMGVAVVHGIPGRAGEAVSRAALVKIGSVKDGLTTASAPAVSPQSHASTLALQRLGGCQSCASPCDFFTAIQRTLRPAAAQRSAFRDFAESVLQGRLSEAPERFEAWRAAAPLDRPNPDHLFCSFVHAASQWTDTVLTARGRLDEESGVRAMRPADRLIAHRLSGQFGMAARPLVDGASHEETMAALQALHEALARALMGSGPTSGLPACAGCPAPCQALPFIATRAAGALAAELALLPRPTASTLSQPANTEMVWPRVHRLLQQDAPGEGPNGPSLATYAYCQLANSPLPPQLEPYRAGLLDRALL